MLALMTENVHDEKRQGEAYQPLPGEEKSYRKKFYIESYGCQMNFADSEIVASILNEQGFGATRNLEDADLIFFNTCSIREKAEQTSTEKAYRIQKDQKSKNRACWLAFWAVWPSGLNQITGRRKVG